MMAKRRIMQEFKELKKEPIVGCTAQPVDDNNISEWTATIKGPPGSPYEGGTFQMTIVFPKDYPFRAPVVKATTRIYHPNIDTEGNICLDILKHNWAPSLTISKVLHSIYCLLMVPNVQFVDDYADSANDYRCNGSTEFDKKAREYTEKYAK
ncbi:hypothetical protein niasHS_002804 [Heterodera schachtii]|uniref:E2 ubiquitin-conjugating enzyme n=1 Tax=Heterodera schachtii TaxID=97005 RepID=A0ABD2K330_HETSC